MLAHSAAVVSSARFPILPPRASTPLLIHGKALTLMTRLLDPVAARWARLLTSRARAAGRGGTLRGFDEEIQAW
jgi:hypothetical protein